MDPLRSRWLVVALVAAFIALSIAALKAAPAAALPAPEAAAAFSPPAGVDLDVTFIGRAPLYRAYCVEYPWDIPNQPGIPYLCTGTETDRRWPEPGEVVTFTAHIINKGTSASPAFGAAWHIDGAEVARSILPSLPPGAEATAIYRWPWAHGLSDDGQRALGEHTVRFTVDPDDAIAETCETNNRLEDRTNAMSFRITLSPEAYAAYNTPVDPKWPWSAEDWLQKQTGAMNAAFANAIYPTTPNGAGLRVRIDTISVTATDPPLERSYDGSWHLRDDVRHEGGYYDPETDIDWGLVHELSHQVSLIDLYAIGVYAPNVFVQDRNGRSTNFGFGWRAGGLMFGGTTAPHNDPHLYESHSAGGAATFAGYRNGYYGSHLFDIPLNNTLRILDSRGNPAAGVAVSLYQRTGPWDWTGHMGVDNTPEISGETDAQGEFLLPNRSAHGGTVTANGHTLHDNPFGVVDIIGNQGLFLIRLIRGDHEEFHWLDITQFNLAYWSGDVRYHTFTIASHVPPASAPVAPELLTPRVTGSRVRLEWQRSPSMWVIGYRVYRATPPMYEYVAVSGILAATSFEEEFWGDYEDGGHRMYAVVAVDEAGRESGFSEPAYVPRLADPAAVAIAPDGGRTVLNNGNLYPLLSQQPGGRYVRRLVNVHYDLGNAGFLAYGNAGELLISSFGESPFGRRGVRLYNADMQPLAAFGEEGATPGRLLAPAGVASWGEACTVGGPYEPDAATSLLLHLDGSYTGSQGEPGTAQGASFTAGKFDRGVLVDGRDTLTYVAAGNIDANQGAVEFWLRPTWDGDDGGNHTLFWWGEGDEFVHLRKDGISNLVFDRFYAGGSCGAPHWVADWRTGEWHHLAFTWQGTEIRLYEDGAQVAQTVCGGVARPTASVFYVGSGINGEQAVDAVIDELRISSAPRLGNSLTCGRILVADSAAHRVQAFDRQGNLVSAFGSFGGGLGQLNTPRGLVVDPGGRVIVVDQGNNRLVVLGFNGQTFDYLTAYESGFNAPTGIAAAGEGYLAVADTGNNRVVVLDAGGGFAAAYTTPNDGYPGSFNAPRGVAIAANGDLVVADTGNQRVVTVRDALSDRSHIWLPLILRD